MRKLLVANRGEIARRVFRSAKSLGINTVAIYSDADAEAAHVADADEAVHVGPSPARQSYLDVDRVLAAARAVGADAIHPGYGFLSENADFAERVTTEGLLWVGPLPATIREMGDKQRARDLAQAAGVPVVPGSGRFEPGHLEGLQEAALAVGFPLLVKAAAGGGGIGMRRVDDLAKLAETVEATQSMAKNSFGDGAVFLERFVPKARHIEIQVFGFGNGRAVHLFERDCSLQRRFQKVVEESPAPGLPREVRDAMAAAAVALCEHTLYQGAGTVEYIVDAETFEFFFLEMNTRIQVEHPVTEMIAGVDLVRMQIAFACGELNGLEQQAIRSDGHAIECRLYAENPEKMFMPSPGPLTLFKLPEQTSVLRIDSGYRQGDAVTPFYDPMLAKVIVHADDRGEACRRAIEALRAIEVQGLKTNRNFLIACLESDAFQAGDVYTGFIDDKRKVLLSV